MKRETSITSELEAKAASDSLDIDKVIHIIKILSNNDCFFKHFTEEQVSSPIKTLPAKKATVSFDIPVSVLKSSIQVYAKKLTTIFNNCLAESTFPNILKYADVTPVFKKGDNTDKKLLSN